MTYHIETPEGGTMTRPTRRQSMGEHWRCDHNTWSTMVVPLIREAQDELGSIRLVSTRIGMNEGWAAKVLEHHLNIISERSIKLLARLVDELRTEKASRAAKEAERAGINPVGGAVGMQNGIVATQSAVASQRLRTSPNDSLQQEVARGTAAPGEQGQSEAQERIPSGDQRQKRHLRELVEAMSAFGMSKPEIAKATGYASWASLQQTFAATQHIPRWRLDRAAGVLQALRDNDYEQARRLWEKPRDMEREPVKDEEAELSGEVRRIGPPPKPPRTATVSVVAEAETLRKPEPARPTPETDAERYDRIQDEIETARQPKLDDVVPAAQVTDPVKQLRERLMEVATEEFDKAKKGLPKFMAAGLDAKYDELLKFIESME